MKRNWRKTPSFSTPETMAFFTESMGWHGKLEAYEGIHPRSHDGSLSAADSGRTAVRRDGGQCGHGALDPRPVRRQGSAPHARAVLAAVGYREGRGRSCGRDSFVYSLHRGDASQPAAKALRTERYKLILNLNPKDKEELYDLKTDPQEMKNLALDNSHRELVGELKRTLLFDMKQLEDPAIAAVEATVKP